MRYEAEVVKCDNCGNTITRKKTGVEEYDGGYTRVKLYEDLPDGWGCEIIFDNRVDLCPKCSAVYRNIIGKHMANLAEGLPGLTNKDGGGA